MPLLPLLLSPAKSYCHCCFRHFKTMRRLRCSCWVLFPVPLTPDNGLRDRQVRSYFNIMICSIMVAASINRPTPAKYSKRGKLYTDARQTSGHNTNRNPFPTDTISAETRSPRIQYQNKLVPFPMDTNPFSTDTTHFVLSAPLCRQSIAGFGKNTNNKH